MKLASVSVVAAVALAWSPAARPDAPPAADRESQIPIRIMWDQKIPMRDGVKLSATIYRDPAQTAPLPAIVMLSPYIASSQGATQGVYFAQRGYVFVAIDDRGRGNSDGVFVPSRVEGKDGYDAIEWVAKQPWCNGSVAMWGGSWLGFTQWSTARERPPHLKAIAPTAPVYPGVDYPQPGGITMSFTLRWLTFVAGRALNEGLFLADALWRNAELELVAKARPFAELEVVTGARGTVFRTWLAHPSEDAFWQAVTPRPEDYAKLQIPILTITGHYDGDQRGALTYYERHLAHASKETAARHWLVIGPWDHSGTRRPKDSLGGVRFGTSAVVDMEALHKAWYDHVLKGGPVPELLKDRVVCFISGRNTWVSAHSLDQLEGPPLRYDLDVDAAVVGDVTRAGRIVARAGRAATVVLTSDPRRLLTLDELDDHEGSELVNQREAYAARPSRIVLHTEAFAAETVLAGRPRLRLQVAVDQPDADLFADLFEILPDGSAVYLAHSQLRLSYRTGATRKLLVPNKPELVELPRFDFFARAIAKGSRLRLVIDAGPVGGWQRNLHTGGDSVNEPLSTARVAKLTIATGGDAGSVLELPKPTDAVH
jgi:putative CocE/NonD family hydrolase